MDAYRPTTKRERNLVNRLAAGGLLHHRADRPLWGKNSWQFVTVTNHDIAKASPRGRGKLANAISAKAGVELGGYTHAWLLNKRATPAQAWGARKNLAQLHYTKVRVPAYRIAADLDRHIHDALDLWARDQETTR